MANEPYDPYIPGGSKGDPAAQGTSNPKTAAIQQQIDDTVRSVPYLFLSVPILFSSFFNENDLGLKLMDC
jgi:hypothetical protein